MFDITILLYQMVVMLYTLMIPFTLLLGLIWLAAMMVKKLVKSLLR